MFGCLNESFFSLNALYPEWRLISFWILLGYGGLLYLFMKSLEKDLKTERRESFSCEAGQEMTFSY